jgi:hypothetical protein
VTVHKIGQLLEGRRFDAVAALALSRCSGWTLVALALAFLVYRLVAEHMRHRTLLVVFDRAPSGTVVSLGRAGGVGGTQVTMGKRSSQVPEKAECGPATESE